ncbi:2-hydroxyacid dehydrogenase [Paraburkholderia ferrariae]|uniref:2-hydroxyacid dehydrogenase n=1 Tax=Paraburkholderia ferrariae TaxID=386056 RepID=UPI0005A81184|nr:2-hydroxyacid dehydrogenase [Paraburkholderia ferrariae]
MSLPRTAGGPPGVLALIPLPEATLAALRRDYALDYRPDGSWPEAAAAATVRAVVTNGSTGLDRARMAALPSLEIVSAFGAGYENVDVAAAAARGIVVTHAPGTNAATVADHALGLMLALARGYAPLTRAVQQGDWHGARGARPTLAGAALGIVGMGRIGRLIAARAGGFDMTIGYHSRSPHEDAPGTHYADLVPLAQRSDFLVLACQGGPATRHLANRAVLRALGPQGYVVNVSRGSVLDTGALLDALHAGEIAGAGLDVIEDEPAVPAALFAHPDVLVTPHMAGRSPAAWLAQRDALLASFAQHFGGERVTRAVAV